MEQKNKYEEWDWGSELDTYDQEMEKYWQEFDKESENFDWNQIQEDNKQQFLNMLKGDLGKDITDVTAGRKFVKLSFKMKLKYWLKRVFEIFS